MPRASLSVNEGMARLPCAIPSFTVRDARGRQPCSNLLSIGRSLMSPLTLSAGQDAVAKAENECHRNGKH